VVMMQQLTGQFLQVYQGNNPYLDPVTGQPVGNTTTGKNKNNTNRATGLGVGVTQGVMQMTFCYVYFGDPKKGLKYYGYIDSWEVQFTHFSQGMIPMRCVVDISFSLLPPPVQNVPPGAAASVAVTQQAGPGTSSNSHPIPHATGF
jgi:hypothetical protein